MTRRRVLILGAAGRDFHNFNTVYRGDPASRQRAIDTLLATMQDLGRAAKTQEPLMEHALRKNV